MCRSPDTEVEAALQAEPEHNPDTEDEQREAERVPELQAEAEQVSEPELLPIRADTLPWDGQLIFCQ